MKRTLNRYLRQFTLVSSEPSPQSSMTSHCRFHGIQCPLSHSNSVNLQIPNHNEKKKQEKNNCQVIMISTVIKHNIFFLLTTVFLSVVYKVQLGNVYKVQLGNFSLMLETSQSTMKGCEIYIYTYSVP